MLATIPVLLMFAAEGPAQATQPRQLDPDAVQQHQSNRDGETTDPWFNRDHVATDDPAFIRLAVESSRQGALDARSAAQRLDDPQLRAAAQKIGAQDEAAARRLEKLARAKGWALPQPNPQRDTTLPQAAPARANANFLLSQISYHENTVAQYRAQIAGQGDPELKRALNEMLPGYQQNLELLLRLKP